MKKVLIAIGGGSLLMVGLVLLVLPGPGVLFLLAGMALLATEFRWARGMFRSMKRRLAKWRRKAGLRNKVRFRRATHSTVRIPGETMVTHKT